MHRLASLAVARLDPAPPVGPAATIALASAPPIERIILRGVALGGLDRHGGGRLTGDAYLAFLRQDRTISSERVARIVTNWAAQPGTQERLTRDLADAIDSLLAPRGVAVLIESPRLDWCSTRDGDTPRLITSRLTGSFAHPEQRAAFFGWANRSRPRGRQCI